MIDKGATHPHKNPKQQAFTEDRVSPRKTSRGVPSAHLPSTLRFQAGRNQKVPARHLSSVKKSELVLSFNVWSARILTNDEFKSVVSLSPLASNHRCFADILDRFTGPLDWPDN